LDHLGPDEELVEAPFQSLIAAHKLLAFVHPGLFWRAMDTLKDKSEFDRVYVVGDLLWVI
jgi:NDP-sugar pyrophosphorylase family protein